ncbi:B-box zinc finger protein 20-like [Typha angustifolia]|uniref:B-box zinc finger protein 20-like n=1 Tax=Typha angustifolia TaxID=59011 RepID=UPI003C2AEC60
MKVQCDVCAAKAASLFCCADEAALCDSCDRRVHCANKLAGKHRRFSLLDPSASSSQSPPLCDICQEKRGFLFCQEDRAILCRDCDISIHTMNDFTKKHTRFLLTGIKLSSFPIPSNSPPEVVEITEIDSGGRKKYRKEEEEDAASSSSNSTAVTAATEASNSSSISEYLIHLLPGYRVEDLLVDSATFTTNTFTHGMGWYQEGEVKPRCAETNRVSQEQFDQAGQEWRSEVPQRMPKTYNKEYGSNNMRSGSSFSYW